MNEPNNPAGVSRRQFLIKAGMATGALAAMPLQSQARFLWDGRPPLRVGVVVLDSSTCPLMGENLAAGMRLSFAEAGWTATGLVVEQADNGSSIVKARRLLAEGNVDVLTGMINPLIVHRLREDLEKSDVLYINMEGGANSYTPRDESPLIFHNSLGYWQSNWSLGSWAATAMGKRAFVISSLYETGYDAYYAFPQGFEKAGGTVLRSEITHLAPDRKNLAELMAAIAAARPDFVYASYSGGEAVDFVRAYGDAGLSGRIPLLASGFTVDEALLPAMGAGAIGIKSCLSWSPAISSPENAAFRKTYIRQTRREADPFALLGYDTGRLITEAVRAASGTVLRSNGLKQALETVAIASPRGNMRVRPGTGSTDTPLYLREVRRDGGQLQNSVIAELPGLAAVELRADREAMTARSGWIDSYLCA
jgi:branched-chain amino acid transport system substrate-binding protein